jgi:hypothetical protein
MEGKSANTALSLVKPDQLPMELSVQDLLAQVRKIQDLMKVAMHEGEHYGRIPGTTKPTLLKAGAEKLNLLFRFDPEYDSVEHHDGDHLTVKSKCTLYHIPTGLRVGSGEGSCSTKESKYAFRAATLACPECAADAIVHGREDFGGGWVCLKKKGGCGARFPEDQFRKNEKVANDALPDVWNTVLKMANKRALIAAVLNSTAASDVFTHGPDEIDEEHSDEKSSDSTRSRSATRQPPSTETTVKQTLWNNLLNHCKGNARDAGKLLKEISGKQFVNQLTDEEAKAAQTKFEAEYLTREPGAEG